MIGISRRKVAHVVGDRLLSGKSQSGQMKLLAAYLIQHKQLKYADLYVRDIEQYLADHGYAVIDVSTVTPLDAALKKQVTELFDKTITTVLREHIDTTLLGGIKIETTQKRFDATIKERLRQLRAS